MTRDNEMSVILCGLPRPQGDPPVPVEKDHDCEECGNTHDLEQCPKCGSWISFGFGLMAGGCGPYMFCNNEECDWVRKDTSGCAGHEVEGLWEGGYRHHIERHGSIWCEAHQCDAWLCFDKAENSPFPIITEPPKGSRVQDPGQE